MPGVDHARLQAVMACLPEAAVDPDRWPELLQQVSDAAGAVGCALLQAEPTGARQPVTQDVTEMFRAYLGGGWESRDPRRRAVAHQLRGEIGVDQNLFEPDFFDREPMWPELLEPFGLRWWAGVGFRVGHELRCVSLQRSIRQGMFDPAEQRLLALLTPRLSEVGILSEAIATARIAATTDALALVRRAAISIDGSGRVTRVNAAAEAIFDDWFGVRGGRLAARDPRAAAEIGSLVDRIRAGRGWIDFEGRKIVLMRGTRRPLVLEALNLDAVAGPFSGGRVLLLISDLEQEKRGPAADILRRLFGLTPAEARLAMLLGHEMSLAEAAGTMGITMLTARSHLKRIFEKAGITRQADLIALLNRIPSD